MVDRVSFRLEKGRALALVGELGSGKTVTAQAIVRLLPQPAASYPTGEILFRGRDVLKMSDGELRDMRGAVVTMVFQEPMTSLNPLYTIGGQIAEPIALYHGRAAAPKARIVEPLTDVGIPDPAERLGTYPYELSGGQRQRVMIAMALANRPDLLIADEPTTALDVTIQAQILKLLEELQATLGMAILLITHDLDVVRRIADGVLVMRHGRVVEPGRTADVFADPQAILTRRRCSPRYRRATRRPVTRAPRRWRSTDNLVVDFRSGAACSAGPSGTLRRSTACPWSCARARPLASSANPAPANRRSAGDAEAFPPGGSFRLGGRPISAFNARAMRPLRRELQLVFQDPFGSLSPRLSVAEIMAEGLFVQGRTSTPPSGERVVERALADTGLDPTRTTATRMSFPAANASASPSPGRWRSFRNSSCSTSRPPPSTCRSRRRSSISCAICRSAANSPICSSRTI